MKYRIEWSLAGELLVDESDFTPEELYTEIESSLDGVGMDINEDLIGDLTLHAIRFSESVPDVSVSPV